MLRNTPIYAESWNVAFRHKPVGTILEDTQTPFTVIRNGFRYWAADPFIVERAGQTYIFAELYDYILRRGVIGYCSISGDKAGKWTPIIREPYHLSYPCITEIGGKLCLMPESGESSTLCIYESVSFPDKWEKKTILRSDAKFADTTPLPCSNANFALTHKVDDPENPQLMLIDLEQQRQDVPVPGKEALRSRPAGHFFRKDGNLIRPAQISLNVDEEYGKGLVFCQCHWASAADYRETEIKEVYPQSLSFDKSIYLDGMHTYNASENYEVIDIKTRRFNILNFIMRIAGKLLRH